MWHAHLASWYIARSAGEFLCRGLTGVLGRDLGVLMLADLPSGGVPLLILGVKLPLLLSLLLLTGLRTLQCMSGQHTYHAHNTAKMGSVQFELAIAAFETYATMGLTQQGCTDSLTVAACCTSRNEAVHVSTWKGRACSRAAYRCQP